MSPDGSNLHEILAGWHPDDLKGCGGWTPERDFFLFLSASSSERSGFPAFQLWALDERHAWVRKPDPRPVQLTSGPITWGTVGWGSPVVPSRDGQKIFIKGTINRGELVRYNRQTGQVEPFLGGISADEVSFSREGRYVAYASFPGRTLWRANKDGTGVQEIAEAMAYPEIPRWSPDGSQISFVDYPPNGQSGRRSAKSMLCHHRAVLRSESCPPTERRRVIRHGRQMARAWRIGHLLTKAGRKLS